METKPAIIMSQYSILLSYLPISGYSNLYVVSIECLSVGGGWIITKYIRNRLSTNESMQI